MKWISVKDRLPIKLIDEVLCSDILNSQFVAIYNNGNFYQADVPNEILLEITHWMPLPEPPSKDKG